MTTSTLAVSATGQNSRLTNPGLNVVDFVAQFAGDFKMRQSESADHPERTRPSALTAESRHGVGSPRSARLLTLLLNSAIAFAIADSAMVTVHEFAHALAAIAMGLHPTVYPGQVIDAVDGTTSQQVTQLLAGPLGSLVTGLAILLLVPAARGFAELLLIWFGALSVQEFTGYLMTGPFFGMGDIGLALHLVAAPLWVYWLLFFVGGLGTLLLGWLFSSRLLPLVDHRGDDTSVQLRCLGLFAWLLGAVLILGYGLGDSFVVRPSNGIFTSIGFFEAVATLTSGVFVFWVPLFRGRKVRERPISLGFGWPVAGAVIFLALNLGRSFILAPSLQL